MDDVSTDGANAAKAARWAPLEVVQIDHTEIDIIVVDELTRTPLPGRPWLNLAIDVFSRVVTGLHVSMSAPSRVSVGLLGTGSANPVSH